MWPKALSQLIELAPHITRLIPMADTFLKTKSTGEDASGKAIDAMAQTLREDLSQISAAHAGLYRQLNDQAKQLDTLAVELRTSRLSTEPLEARLTQVEKQLEKLPLFFGATFALLAGIFIALFLMMLQHNH